jgi:mannose-6-phosphate isomerase-like protein (cupin superfamily)
MRSIEGAGQPLDTDTAAYAEQLRVPAMSVGTYTVRAGSPDLQQPHTEDEIYLVTAGRARLETPTGTAEAVPGAVLFVPAGEEHRFVDVTEDLTVVVVFAPAEHSLREVETRPAGEG